MRPCPPGVRQRLEIAEMTCVHAAINRAPLHCASHHASVRQPGHDVNLARRARPVCAFPATPLLDHREILGGPEPIVCLLRDPLEPQPGLLVDLRLDVLSPDRAWI